MQGKTKFLIAAAVAAMAGLPAAPAAAQTMVLDFAGSICGAAGNQACGNGSQIGQNYGDSANVDVGYRVFTPSTGVTVLPYLSYWSGGYGDLTSVVYGGPDGAFTSEIIFTPTAGFEVSLIGFDSGCYQNRARCQTLNYDITSIGGAGIASGSTSTLFPGHASLGINSAYFSDGIILRWGPDSYDVGLDNITFDVRAIAGGPGGVPEPATWAFMILGFGAVGGAMRRRGARAVLA